MSKCLGPPGVISTGPVTSIDSPHIHGKTQSRRAARLPANLGIMKTALHVALLGASLAGCAAVGPMNETERAGIRAVAPVRAQFVPVVDFRVPPGKDKGAASGALGGALGVAQGCVYTGPFFLACMAAIGIPAAAIFGVAGAALTPSNEGVEALVLQAREALGDVDVQHLIVKKFADAAARFTSYEVLPATAVGGPGSARDRPTYASAGYPERVVVAEVYVETVGATLVDITGLSQTEYADRRPRIGLVARMRLVRPADGTTLMDRRYRVLRFGRRIGDYEEDWTLLARALAGAVDEAAIQMVDDAFVLHQGSASTAVGTNRPRQDSRFGPDGDEQAARTSRVTPLEPVPSGSCFGHSSFDCWALNRVPQLDTRSPRFRWAPFPDSSQRSADPVLRDAHDLVYDLWVFGAEENRLVEGLKATEFRFDVPLPACARFSWAVRARFRTAAGPRAVDWSSASSFSREEWQGGTERPAFGAPFITPCESAPS